MTIDTDEIDLDETTAEWVDGSLWFEGTDSIGRDVSVGFVPTGKPHVGGFDPDFHGVACDARLGLSLEYVYDREAEEHIDLTDE